MQEYHKSEKYEQHFPDHIRKNSAGNKNYLVSNFVSFLTVYSRARQVNSREVVAKLYPMLMTVASMSIARYELFVCSLQLAFGLL